MKYSLRTYGCTLNAADSDIMRGILAAGGHTQVRRELDADVVIINSCQVKSSTEQKILQKLSDLSGEKRRILLAGCLAINQKAVWRSAHGATILGTSSISQLGEALEDAMLGGRGVFRNASSKEGLPRSHPSGPISRVPIAEGCLSACTFCVTRMARGRLSSFTPKGVVRECEIALSHGARELQLTAQDTGAYGREINTSLNELLPEVCALRGDFRVRLGMINPQHVLALGSSFFDCLGSRKMYKFLHLPLQSGSDSVLAAMNRGYSMEQFRRVAAEFRRRNPTGVLATDIIVGFPTETEEDFEQTLLAMREFAFDVVNISKFTPRPLTPAKRMKQLASEIVKERSEIASELAWGIEAKNNERLVGKTCRMLVTQKQKTLSGRNNDYRQIVLPRGAKAELGEWVKVRITKSSYAYLTGELVRE